MTPQGLPQQGDQRDSPPYEEIFTRWAYYARETASRLRAENRRRDASLAGARADVYNLAAIFALDTSDADAVSEFVHRAGPERDYEAETDTFVHTYRTAWLNCARRIDPHRPEVYEDDQTWPCDGR